MHLRADALRYQPDGLPICTLDAVRFVLSSYDPRSATRIKVPFLISHGTDDTTISMTGSKLVFAISSTPDHCKHLQLLEGCKHNLLADTMDVDVMRDAWSNFIAKALSAGFEDLKEGAKLAKHSATYGTNIITEDTGRLLNV